MPTRSLDRSNRADAERALADRVGNVGKRTLHILQPALDDAELVHVFDQPFRTGVAADDARPSFGERHAAPRPSRGAGQADVDERALARNRAPPADRLVARAGPREPALHMPPSPLA